MKPEIDLKMLASLSRMEIGESEAEKLAAELPSIIAFVEAISRADVSDIGEDAPLRNVLRTDSDPHESGAYTETLLEDAPAREGNRVAVKQVVTRKR